MLVGPFDFKAQAGGVVFFVTDHHVDVFGDLAVDPLRRVLAALARPQRGAIVEVIGDDGAVFLGDLHRFDDGFGGVGSECGKDAAGVEPAHAFFAEDFFPVDFTGANLRGGGIGTVGAAKRRTDAEAFFGEVEADAGVLAHAVKITPDAVAHIDAALHDQVFDQPAEVILRQGGGDHGAFAPAFAHGAGDVVFAAAFPDLEAAGITHAAKAGIETEHDFAEGGTVPAAFAGRLDDEFAHGVSFLL